MTQIYINKGDSKGPWVGAAILQNDNSLELFGHFAYPDEEDAKEDAIQIKKLWTSAPAQQMMAGDMQEGEDELVIEEDAPDSLVDEVRKAKYLAPFKNTV